MLETARKYTGLTRRMGTANLHLGCHTLSRAANLVITERVSLLANFGFLTGSRRTSGSVLVHFDKQPCLRSKKITEKRPCGGSVRRMNDEHIVRRMLDSRCGHTRKKKKRAAKSKVE